MASNPYYFVFRLPELTRGEAFYAELFGWALDHGHAANLSFPGGLQGDVAAPAADIYFAIETPDALDAAVETITNLGGRCEPILDSRTGLSTTCVDAGNTRFCIGWERPEFLATWDKPAALPAGELGFISIPTPNPTELCDLFSAIFGWDFDAVDPHADDDGYRFTATPTPNVGLQPAGDHAGPTLYFVVDDIDAAATKVEALGGTAGQVNHVRSGTNASCVDDQGVPFSLWVPADGFA